MSGDKITDILVGIFQKFGEELEAHPDAQIGNITLTLDPITVKYDDPMIQKTTEKFNIFLDRHGQELIGMLRTLHELHTN